MYEEVEKMGERAGRVIDIAGRRLMYKRRSNNGQISTFQAYIGMPFSLNDHFITDANTSAALEFLIGGKATIAPAMEIVITGERDIQTVGNQTLLKAGRVWRAIGSFKERSARLGPGGIEG